MIDKGICDKGFIRNRRNCDCQCDKSYDVGEYLDYENCKYRNKVDKVIEVWSENIDGNEIIHKDYENVCNFFTICIVLFFIGILIIISTSGAFIYFHWSLRCDSSIVILIIVPKQ